MAAVRDLRDAHHFLLVFHRNFSRFSDGCPKRPQGDFSIVAEVEPSRVSQNESGFHFGKTVVPAAFRLASGISRISCAAMSTAAKFFCEPEIGETNGRSLFVQPWFANAPLVFAQLDARGIIHALNPALRQMLLAPWDSEPRRLSDLLDPDLHQECDRLIGEMFHGERNSFQLQSTKGTNGRTAMRWTVWRVPGWNGPDWALASGESLQDRAENEDRLRQIMRCCIATSCWPACRDMRRADTRKKYEGLELRQQASCGSC